MSHSGLQKQVLQFYKKCLLAAKQKPNREEAMAFVRNEFRSAPVKRSEFRRIEFLLRQGEKQLKLYSRPNTVNFYKQ